jgi:hypothetical protein
MRAQVAVALGKKPLPVAEWAQKVYDVGNVHEPACVAAMEAEGWAWASPNWLDLGWDEDQHYVELTIGDSVVTGHLDGIGYDPTNMHQSPRVVEIKSPGAWEKFERHIRMDTWRSDPQATRYAYQLSVYMLATGLEAVVACWDEEHGVRTFGVELPPVPREEIEARVAEMDRRVRDNILPSECDQRDNFCPVPYLHDDAPAEVEDERLESLASQYDDFSADIKRLTAERDEVRDQLLAHGGGVTAGWKVTVYEDKGRVSYDYDAMSRAGIPIQDFEKKAKPSKRVKVTPRDTEQGS